MRVNGTGRSEVHSESLSRDFRGHNPLRKFLDSEEHLDWLKIDLNIIEIIFGQDYRSTKKLI